MQDFDEYKEFARLIDEISPREFLILQIMDPYKDLKAGPKALRKKPSSPPRIYNREEWDKYDDQVYEYENSMVIVHPVGGKRREIPILLYRWEVSEEVVKQQLNITRDRLVSLMYRLTRTGCVEERAFPTYEGNILAYKLTPLYVALKEYVEKEDGRIL